jgi:tetratricopeptide (TPR) repeat protein
VSWDIRGHLRTELQSGVAAGSSSDRLNSWKEIAAFFDKDVRTVRRWESVRGLPVHRMPGGARSGVFAYVWELEQWLADADGTDADGAEAEVSEDLLETEAGVTTDSGEFVVAVAPAPVAAESQVDASRVASAASFLRRNAFTVLGVMAVVVAGIGLFALRERHERQVHSAEAALRVTRGKPSSNPEAQELYLRGLYLWNQRTEASLTEAVDLFTQAIVLDPHFAAGYAGLADSYILLRQYGHMTDGDAFPRALAASRQALLLDDDSHQAHRAYAFLLNYWMWNFPEAEREFKRSIELSPDDAQTHSWYATSLFSAGRREDAVREIDIARRLQPDSISILANRGLLLGAVDQSAGLAYLLQLERVNPNFPSIHSYIAGIYFDRGDYRDALEENRKAAVLGNDTSEVALLDQFRRELEVRGPEAMLAAEAESYGREVDAGRTDAMQPASLYARLGDKERTLHYLTLACERHEANFPLIGQDTAYRKLEGDPEFSVLMVQREPLDLASALKTR